ncbi:CDP-alcohol phosphatidyltransferase family protein [Methanoregula formicica]|uniref:Phosphatidylglycerophosphate synthase n=1 Tax=Methanoregula formicica (strain DSM 22288 / NBRC 105244 / SMSP) TaxID=593750 RepID=L0HDA6_METFS|nr:CDP-alcohol phosphatidyltransferase family protein [Methanoregula formicica]AGB01766.1 phosphatidylglycerophosphate synthase [Methanoregula formicica SMSP]
MTLDQYRSSAKVFFDPLVAVAIRCRLTPNFFTIAALLASMAAGLLFFFNMLLWAVVAVAANAFCDAMDGAVAREMKAQSKRGDFLDHAVDRYADIFIITGIFAGGLVPWQIGVFALTGVLMSSYLGTQAQAVGVGRYYGGVLGRADRLVMILVVGVASLLYPSPIVGLTLLGWMLVLFGLFGHITALQRFAYIWAKVE